MIPAIIQKRATALLTKTLGEEITITGAEEVAGGCVHNAHRIDSNLGSYFIKWNSKDNFINYQAESRGLDMLAATKTLRTPKPICTGKAAGFAFLIVEYITPGERDENYWTEFGASLARLHRNGSETFGLDEDNFIGDLPQSNKRHESWLEFYVKERIEPQLQFARDRSLADRALLSQFNKFINKIDRHMPEGKPALLHGDLWAGNCMTGKDGLAVVFDPAVYYGHREAEIAFTKLFGDFDKSFYTAYNEEWALESGWEDRLNLFNLYPLLVHLNLFGSGYRPQLENAIKKYV